jgi:hypothetical protein
MLTLFITTTALAANEPPDTAQLEVTAVSLYGSVLRVEVTDASTGYKSEAAVNLSDYSAESASPSGFGGREYITVQAADADGNHSAAVMLKNPNYVVPGDTPSPEAIPLTEITDEEAIPNDTKPDEPLPTAEPNPFTPDGTGTVVDNAANADGKEFFTIQTKDEKVFYLIVDRERDSENVYFLDNVTVDDLKSLAEDSGEPPAPTLAVPTPEQTAAPAPEPSAQPQKSGLQGGSVVFIVIAAIAVGGAGWYFKIYRPKQSGGDDDYDDYGDEENDETEDDDEL